MASALLGALRIELEASIAKFVSDMEAAGQSVSGLQQTMRTAAGNLTQAGAALTAGITAPIVGLAGAALKASVDFETGFAGVRKTVDATEPELQALAEGFRQMAKEIPVSVIELTNIGEAAGQLGIETENILGFTRTMADLGATTNLSSDQAATALARLANITGMSQGDFDRLGSSIVNLGNNLATTEAEIVEFGLRIAGAGNQLGLSEPKILAIGAALSSVGINAEAGGTAISRVMIDMKSAIEAGGDELELFAMTAGMSVGEFKRLFEQDASKALVAFTSGIGTLEERGMSATTVLDDMGFSNVRVRDALLRTAGASGLLSEALQIGVEGWEDTGKLLDEAETRYGTTESKIKILWNRLTDVAITLGDALAPALATVLGVVDGLIPKIESAAKGFAELDPKAQNVVIAIAGLAAVLGPILVTLGAFAGSIAAISAAIPIVIAGFGLLFSPLGLLAVAVGAVVLAWAKWDEIVGIAQRVYDGVKRVFFDAIEGAVDLLIGPIEEVLTIFGVWDETVEIAKNVYDGIKRVFIDAIIGAVKIIKTPVDEIVTIFEVWNDIIDVAQAVYDGVKGWLVDSFQGVIDTIIGSVESVVTSWGAWDEIVTITKRVYDGIKEWFVDTLLPLFNAGGVVLVAIYAVVTAWRSWDEIVEIAKRVYDGIKQWFVDKLQGIVDGVKEKVDAVIGFFGNLYDTVVGNSIIPDLVNDIGKNIGRLDQVMVKQVDKFTGQAVGIFEGFSDKVTDVLGGLFGKGVAGGAIGSIVSEGMNAVFGVGGIIPNLLTSGMQAMGRIALKGLQAIGGFFKKIFGGPSAEELAGREIVANFEQNLNAMLTDSQRIEAGNEEWKGTVIAIRDAYVENGLSVQDAQRDAERLWKSSKDGGEDTKKVIEEITRKMGGFADEAERAERAMRNLAKSTPPSSPNVPHMAHGGIVTRPTLAVIGEAGPEAVIPLRQMGDTGMGAGTAVLARIERLLLQQPAMMIRAWRDAQMLTGGAL